MKKRVIIISSILLVILVPFIISICQFINKFHELSLIDVNKKSYKLTKNFISVLDIRKNKEDTIFFKGPMIINFWASWCKPCLEEFPSLELLKTKYPEVRILLFSFDSLMDQKNIISRRNLTLPAFFIADTSVFKYPGILPMTYIIKDSIVIKELFGKKNWVDSSLTEMIKSIEN